MAGQKAAAALVAVYSRNVMNCIEVYYNDFERERKKNTSEQLLFISEGNEAKACAT